MQQAIIPPRLVAWESTRACNLDCVHCRAEAVREHHPEQLTTQEAFRLVDDIGSWGKPVILIISGGEPLLREDIYEVAARGTARGLRVVMSPNGTLLTPERVRRIKEAGVARISVSLDGSSAERNDSFRMVSGAFEQATRGLGYAREANLPFQVNTTVTRRNLDDLPAMLRTVADLGAVTWDVFMLVPTGRGRLEDEVTPQQYEEVLRWLHAAGEDSPVPIHITCAPHYLRVERQEGALRGGHGHGGAPVKGCMAGNGFAFVSHVGEVYPCGYFQVRAGSVRERSFREIYEQAELFQTLRDPDLLHGKCGRCEYRHLCGGCRARALGAVGDYLGEEPYCVHEPVLRA
ncbi:MAG: radical SAM protein [Thermaerobacter sp.]|nr:radical SAM protein [Thermaerobacter sp.]